MSSINQQYLAEQLGVSKTTVSMVLNNKPGISAATRERIIAGVETFGYKVGKKILDPKTVNVNIVLIIFKMHGKILVDNPFFSSLIESIEQKADKEGCCLSVRYINHNSDLSEFDSNDYGGILLLGTEMDENHLRSFIHYDHPLVILDNSFPLLPINTVSIDNTGGAISATRYLSGKGHTNIGYMKSAVTIQNFTDRYNGYECVMQEIGSSTDDVIHLDPTIVGSYRDMMQWLSQNKLTATAFVADNDCIALGAVRALRESGYILGLDISVVGFDDMPFAHMYAPALTTVKPYIDVLGETALTRLIQKIRNPNAPFCHTTIGTTLEIRDSVIALR